MMKKLILAVFVVGLLTSCSSGLFAKKERLGCKTNGRNIGAEKIAAGDPKAIRASKKAKFKGVKSY
ncbi:MAG: hypothetical protein KF880_08395 [Ferruginibacter sp.]|nr:hypothetical protein [Ferruginibacter sp.]